MCLLGQFARISVKAAQRALVLALTEMEQTVFLEKLFQPKE